jgi:hypothetical protein
VERYSRHLRIDAVDQSKKRPLRNVETTEWLVSQTVAILMTAVGATFDNEKGLQRSRAKHSSANDVLSP